ncbi:MAG: heavy metal translocating P-type ATPase metal-binding domain-containing protein [Bacteroidota bacterium]|nr:heavy metal translocating P-type ATPase metal-binding domain-containing protein [Bacteroidota bacterium]
MQSKSCYHCGETVKEYDEILFDNKSFCCTGCKTVYEIFRDNDLQTYYSIEKNPGKAPNLTPKKYDFLENESIASKLLEFDEDNIKIVSLYVPQIHCSSCIWILENLNKLNKGIISSKVNFHQKKVRITFKSESITLKESVLLLVKIGYEPYISLENYDRKEKPKDRSLIYKAGVAFFCYGNVMLLSFPEYFGFKDHWLEEYKLFFRGLIFLLSLPSFFYSASIYHQAAYKSIVTRNLDINVPMSLGLIVMFVRSVYDMFFDYGQGYFDTLTSLVFFMLLGRLFQQKTYDFISFERDFKSYFPIAVTKLKQDKSEEAVSVYQIQKGDRILVRNQELIPVDGVLMSDKTQIDYSFVTGEMVPIQKQKGDKIFAGGKQIGGMIELEVVNTISHSYLTQLWDSEVFEKQNQQTHTTLITKVSRYFTPILISIALLGFLYWAFVDLNIAFNVFTAVLIIACPCALALTTPFTLGNVIRILGKNKFYLKNTIVIEQMAKVDTLIFDKTGTITTNNSENVIFEGKSLSPKELSWVKAVTRQSNHPLSRKLYESISQTPSVDIQKYNEYFGEGIEAVCDQVVVKLGSAVFVGVQQDSDLQTKVYLSINGEVRGKFVFKNKYRAGVDVLFGELKGEYDLEILSGDNSGEREVLKKMFQDDVKMNFDQKPDQKYKHIAQLQTQGKNVMMIGDGLNDAAALKQSNVGIAVSENTNVFSPACDGILDADNIVKLSKYLKLSRKSMKVIKWSFGLSIFYNIVGIYFALTNQLSPLVATIIMPISTITIVSFVTIMSNYYARKILKK